MKKRCGLVIFVRHGQTDHNLERRFQGHLDTELNATGKGQAQRAGKFLAELFDQAHGKRALQLEQIYSSDLKRAHETALAIATEIQAKLAPCYQANQMPASLQENPVPVATSVLLREIDVGLFAGHTFAEFEQQCPEVCKNYFDQYSSDPQGTAYPQGESRRDVVSRILNFYEPSRRDVLDDFLSDAVWHNRNLWNKVHAEIIVGHGAALGFLLAEILGQQQGNKTDSLKLDNADCVVIGHFRWGAKILQHAKIR